MGPNRIIALEMLGTSAYNQKKLILSLMYIKIGKALLKKIMYFFKLDAYKKSSQTLYLTEKSLC